MIHFAHGLKVFICTEPTDMRRSLDGLSGMVQSVLKADPLSGHLFLFRNRARDSIKILYWDRDGLALWYKRRLPCLLLANSHSLPYQRDAQASGSSALGLTRRTASWCVALVWAPIWRW